MGTKRTPPPTPAATATMPRKKVKTKSMTSHAHHGKMKSGGVSFDSPNKGRTVKRRRIAANITILEILMYIEINRYNMMVKKPMSTAILILLRCNLDRGKPITYFVYRNGK
jgi:hypothetical protein